MPASRDGAPPPRLVPLIAPIVLFQPIYRPLYPGSIFRHSFLPAPSEGPQDSVGPKPTTSPIAPSLKKRRSTDQRAADPLRTALPLRQHVGGNPSLSGKPSPRRPHRAAESPRLRYRPDCMRNGVGEMHRYRSANSPPPPAVHGGGRSPGTGRKLPVRGQKGTGLGMVDAEDRALGAQRVAVGLLLML